jgi:hypothetical protein
MVLKPVYISHKPRNIEDISYGMIQDKYGKIQDGINQEILNRMKSCWHGSILKCKQF